MVRRAESGSASSSISARWLGSTRHATPVPLLQAGQEIGVIAVVGVGDHAGMPDPVGTGPVEQRQGDPGLGREGHVLGDLGLAAAFRVVGPALVQGQPRGDRPGDGAFGVVAVDGDLAIGGLAQGAGILAGDADGAPALLGEAGVVEDQHAVALGGQGEHPLAPLAVEVLLVPDHGRQQALEALLGGAGDDPGEGVAVLVGMLGEQAGGVAFQGLRPLAAPGVDAEGVEEFGQLGRRDAGGVGDSGTLHTRTTSQASVLVHLTKQYY